MRTEAAILFLTMVFGIALLPATEPTAEQTNPATPATASAATVVAQGKNPTPGVRAPASPVLSGADFTVTLSGKAHAVLFWQFGYAEQELARGRARLDANGKASLRFVAPDVRHRSVCRFMVSSADRMIGSDNVVVYPARMLATAQKAIKSLEIGVIDEDGRMARSLQAEKVAFGNLRTQLQRDAFEGGMIILAGFRRPEMLSYECRKLRGRLKKGMVAAVVNPPAGWRWLGIRRVELRPSPRGRARLSQDWGVILQAADLGTGPWRSSLAGRSGTVLAGFTPATKKAGRARPARHKQALVVARSVGRGQLIVAMLPHMSRPDDNAVRRAVLAEMILWTLRQRHPERE